LDLPVLIELVRRLEVNGDHRVGTPLAVGDLSERQVEAALRRLEADGYIDGVSSQLSYPAVITRVTPRALRAVEAWPSAEVVAIGVSLLWPRSLMVQRLPTSDAVPGACFDALKEAGLTGF
jgi:hypothetical protein